MNYSTGSIIMEEMVSFSWRKLIIARKSVRFVGSTIIIIPFCERWFYRLVEAGPSLFQHCVLYCAFHDDKH